MHFLEKYRIKSLYTLETWVKMRMGGVLNKNLKNVWLQNNEILSSFHKTGLKLNPISFFVNKIMSGVQQYIKKN